MTEIKPAEFDRLEISLLTQKCDRDIYAAAAEWIFRKFNAAFVVFTANGREFGVKEVFSRCGKIPEKMIRGHLAERRSCGADLSAPYRHKSGTVTAPYSRTALTSGYLLIGLNPGGGRRNVVRLCRTLIPVIRILNKALVALDSRNIYVEAARIENAFSHYVPPDVVHDIRKDPGKIHLGGEKRFLTCVFTDLRNFTRLTERISPAMLVKILNMYLNEMSQVIITLGGTIDKFVGDAMMAFFGAPNRLEDHAVRCCLASVRMKRMETLLNAQLLGERLIDRPLFTRIGIHSGDMIVGNVGSMQRLAYTVIGQNVNIASRIENANKKYGTGILISETTYKIVRKFFDCRAMGATVLRGVSMPINLYELLGARESALPDYCNYKRVSAGFYPGGVSDVEEV